MAYYYALDLEEDYAYRFGERELRNAYIDDKRSVPAVADYVRDKYDLSNPVEGVEKPTGCLQCYKRKEERWG